MSSTDFSPEIIEFEGFSQGDTVSKLDVMGAKLWQKFFERSPKFGGASVAWYGVPGSGKTSLMLQACSRVAKEHQNEIIFWREPSDICMQITNLGIPLNIFSDSKSNIQIKELTETGTLPTKDYKVLRFKTPSQLMKLVQPGVNVVYFHDRLGWLRLIRRLKSDLKWYSFFFDEAEDIFSSRVGGKEWYVNEQFCSEMKELRKARISLYLNSQCDWDIDPRLKTKIQGEVFLYGSKKDKNSPLYRGVMQSIELGEGYICYAHSLFGKIRFKPVEPREKQYIALSSNRSR